MSPNQKISYSDHWNFKYRININVKWLTDKKLRKVNELLTKQILIGVISRRLVDITRFYGLCSKFMQNLKHFLPLSSCKSNFTYYFRIFIFQIEMKWLTDRKSRKINELFNRQFLIVVLARDWWTSFVFANYVLNLCRIWSTFCHWASVI